MAREVGHKRLVNVDLVPQRLEDPKLRHVEPGGASSLFRLNVVFCERSTILQATGKRTT